MAAITLIRTPAETAPRPGLRGRQDEPAGRRRRRARRPSGASPRRGLPHRRVEDFKYTDLRAALREAAPFAATAERRRGAGRPLGDRGLRGPRRRRARDRQRPFRARGLGPRPAAGRGRGDAARRGAGLGPSAARPDRRRCRAARDNPVYQLNSAFMARRRDDPGRSGEVETPLHLRFVTAGDEPVATATRVLVVVEEGAPRHPRRDRTRARAAPATSSNDVVEIVVGRPRRWCSHVRLNAEGRATPRAVDAGGEARRRTSRSTPSTRSSDRRSPATRSSSPSRASIRPCGSNGATMLKGRQHADTTLVVDHAVPHGESRELFKTVIDGDATGVFQGKIIVQPIAQKTDGRMMSAALLLSDGGTMNNKPELEIFADDVQCAHGATGGPARRGPPVLPARPRAAAARGREPAGPGLPGRGARGGRARGRARGARRHGRGVAAGAGLTRSEWRGR